MTDKPKPKRKSRSHAKAAQEDLDRFAKSRAMIIENGVRAAAQRSKDRDFHGLEKEFAYAQAEITADYEKSRDVKHPRDVGAIRETLLRRFLSESGHLPRRYGVSRASFRVASTSGHLSREIDIALFDPLDSISLMRREDVFEVLPVESVYGVIQVKSRLTARELDSALENIASFKALDPITPAVVESVGRPKSQRGFGIIFAYETELDGYAICNKVLEFCEKNPSSLWPNAIVILNAGVYGIGSDQEYCWRNEDLTRLIKPTVHGLPEQGDTLFEFHSLLVSLLRATSVSEPSLERYYRLPLVSGKQSYSFTLGAHVEFGACATHGDFARKISDENLAMVIKWCEAAEAINWVRANDLAHGRAGDNEAAYQRQPGAVRIYNPDDRPLPDIMVKTHVIKGKPTKFLDYDMIDTAGMRIVIPHCYSMAQDIVSGCPACRKRGKAA